MRRYSVEQAGRLTTANREMITARNYRRAQDNFECWLMAGGREFTRRAGYVNVWTDNQTITVRFADHAEANGGGYHMTAFGDMGKTGESDLSLDPESGNTLADACQKVLSQNGPAT